MISGDAKYLTYKSKVGKLTAIIFDNLIEHSEIAIGLCLQSKDIHGAGFIYMDLMNKNVHCYGKSLSLNAECQKDDVLIFQRMLKMIK